MKTTNRVQQFARGLKRRDVLAGAGACALAAGLAAPARAFPSMSDPKDLALGPRQRFDFALLKDKAREAAARPWQPPSSSARDILRRIDFDAYQQIRYRRAMTLMLDEEGRVPVQLFHLGKAAPEPVRVHLVRSGVAHEVLYRTSLFAFPEDHLARELPDDIGFAGFRVMSPDLETDWLAYLGAAYFRTSGPFNQYGISARGMAIGTGLPTPEEFPRFSEFWLAHEGGDGEQCTVYAMLESPRLTGALKMSSLRTRDARGVYRIVTEVESEVYAREDIERLGVAPFSSMYWYGEADRPKAMDWRPEIHDSDGLALFTGSGERIWRPLGNPPRAVTSTFVDKDVRGFGLLQRDREFGHYQDDGVFYDKRPSVWVEPLEDWGEGAVHLLEFPTDSEFHDNVAAYWCPAEPFRKGERRRYRYRLSWVEDVPLPSGLCRTVATWMGRGGRPSEPEEGVRKFVIDFEGDALAGLGRVDGVEAVVTPSRGTITHVYAHPVVGQDRRWRAVFDIGVGGTEPVILRAYLHLDGRALSETWLYQYFPEV